MLKTEISPVTKKPVSRLCLSVGEQACSLFKAISEIQHITPEQCFEQAIRPYILALVEELSMRPDADVEALESIEYAVNHSVFNGRKEVAA